MSTNVTAIYVYSTTHVSVATSVYATIVVG